MTPLDAGSVLKAALADLSDLVDAGAPSRVLGAARSAIEHYKQSRPVPRWARDILTEYAAKRGAQNRYGK